MTPACSRPDLCAPAGTTRSSGARRSSRTSARDPSGLRSRTGSSTCACATRRRPTTRCTRPSASPSDPTPSSRPCTRSTPSCSEYSISTHVVLAQQGGSWVIQTVSTSHLSTQCSLSIQYNAVSAVRCECSALHVTSH